MQQLTRAATATGQRYFFDLRTRDLTSLRQLACSYSTLAVTQAQLDQIANASARGAATVRGTSATVDGEITVRGGASAAVVATLAYVDGGWCLDHAA